MKRKQGSQPLLCAPLGGIWHSCLLSQTLLDRSPKDGGARQENFQSFQCSLYFFELLLVSPPLPLFLVGSHDSFFFSRAEVFRWPRWERRRGTWCFLSRFTRSCLCHLDTRIAYCCKLFRHFDITMTTLLKTHHLV